MSAPSLFFLILLALLLVWVGTHEWRLRTLLRGKDARSLEDTISGLVRDVTHMQKLEPRVKKSVQGIGTVRFKAWPNEGSNQSFAIALLNEHGDGVVFSSLSSRDRVRVFAKPIARHASEYELTPEEKQAIQQAAAHL